MTLRGLDQVTLAEIQKLVEANFAGRDELYAAAGKLDDEARKQVCRKLADHLGGHAAELQQVLLAHGTEPVGPSEIPALADALFDLVKATRGPSGVIGAAEKCEHDVKEEYDCAIDAAASKDAEELLHKQREEVEFGEQVLRSMKKRGSEQHKDDV